MKNWKMILIIAAVVLALVSAIRFVGDFSDVNSPVDKYYDVDIKNLSVEQNLDEVMPMLQEATEELKKMQAEGAVDWTAVDADFEKALSSLESKKAEIEKIDIEDQKVKEINTYLISSYEGMISGYRELLKAFKEGNSDMLNTAGEKLTKAQSDIQKWQDMLNQ